ncbi:MAG: gamma-glutamylcyclotransferase [Chloroflexi bacterium]|nr:gamma-glutamylcyclotransferase [Chloroflexota bacterium]MBP8058352.1 gamma-glutamylcyclotransferase [Chloroflexota bacterium]
MQNVKFLPIFAYGTLMPGQPNYYIWAQYVLRTEPATFPRGRIHHLGGFPMLSEGGDSSVQGYLVEIAPAVYEECLEDLDYLENYRPDDPERSLYQRVEREVELACGRKTQAWVYVGNSAVTSRYPVITSGDWSRLG